MCSELWSVSAHAYASTRKHARIHTHTHACTRTRLPKGGPTPQARNTVPAEVLQRTGGFGAIGLSMPRSLGRRERGAGLHLHGGHRRGALRWRARRPRRPPRVHRRGAPALLSPLCLPPLCATLLPALPDVPALARVAACTGPVACRRAWCWWRAGEHGAGGACLRPAALHRRRARRGVRAHRHCLCVRGGTHACMRGRAARRRADGVVPAAIWPAVAIVVENR